jgi:hypothetical protein
LNKTVFSITKDDVTKCDPPQVFFKQLNRPEETTGKHKEDINILKGNLNELIHLITKRKAGAGPSPSRQDLAFQS